MARLKMQMWTKRAWQDEGPRERMLEERGVHIVIRRCARRWRTKAVRFRTGRCVSRAR